MMDFNFEVKGNMLIITPIKPPFDNSVYEITLRNIKSKDGTKLLTHEIVKIPTRFTPAYTTLMAVKSLVESFQIPDELILFYIREASLFVEYARQESFEEGKVPFEVTQYVKYKAAYDSLLRHYLDLTTQINLKGQIDEISFEKSFEADAFKALLDELKEQVDYWEDHLLGYGFKGKAAPKSAVRGSKYNPNIGYGLNHLYPPKATRLHGYGREVSE